MEQLRTVYGDTPQWDKVKSAKQATFDKEDAAKRIGYQVLVRLGVIIVMLRWMLMRKSKM